MTATPLPAPGLYLASRVSFDDYCRWDAVNQSRLKHAVRSMAHYHAAMQAEATQSDAKRVGSALHLAILEPERYATDVVVSPEFNRRTNQGKADEAKFLAEHAGKCVVDADEKAQIDAMRESALRSKAVRAVMEMGAQCETSGLWQDVTGLTCKMRIDRLSFASKSLVDLKSARDASREGFARACAQYGYPFQAAFYRRGMRALTGEDWRFTFIALEKEPPYAVAVYEPSEQMLEVGENQVETALRRVAACKEANEWPAYEDKVASLDLPAWAASEWVEN